MKINGAVFDMDGTLVDSLTFWASLWKDIGTKYLQDPSFTVPKDVDRKIRTMVLKDAMVLPKSPYRKASPPTAAISFPIAQTSKR